MQQQQAIGQSSNSFPAVKESVIKNQAVMRGQISWSFRDIASGQELDAYQSKALLTPASTLKLFTTGTAIQTLGIEYRFTTSIGIIGKRKRASIHGDLVVRGDGDPSFGSGLAGSLSGDSVLARIAKMLIDSGIEKVNGDIVIDAYKWPVDQSVIPRNWIWEDIGNYYGTGAWGLNWRANEFTIKFSPGKTPNDSVCAEIVSPWARYLSLKSDVKCTDNERREVYVFSAPFSDVIFAEGKSIAGSESYTERASLPNPPLAFGLELKAYLQALDIEVEGDVIIKDTRNLPLRIWQSVASPSLDELVFETNQRSNNLFAECIGKELARNYFDKDYPVGKFLEHTLNEYKPEADLDMQLVDGSGLSRNNRISTSFMSRYLRHKTKISRFPYFLKSIPLAGEEGTMRSFTKINQLRAKSGSMEGVRAYAGYFFDANNHWISFSMISNSIPLSQKETKTMMANLLESASKYAFELPFKFASPSTVGDTIRQFSEVILMQKQLDELPEINKETGEKTNKKIQIRFVGEPDIENPYFMVFVESGEYPNQHRLEYRMHAQTRIIERKSAIDNTWEAVQLPANKPKK
jgi:serine-type D-Ala-D-Ala carboxypeptidase/endopeptidase (penicillin-binding protein 4)